MTPLEWDAIGERVFQTGVDRGVLYLNSGSAVPWNGITGMEEGSNSDLKSFYMDGIKFLEKVSPGEFLGKLKAITYPDEFDEMLGIVSTSGLSFHEQPPKSFSLSYRTKIGNDVDGDAHGYKIHLLYNLVAIPDARGFESQNQVTSPVEFSWSLTGTPPSMLRHRPTIHMSIDSTETSESVLDYVERILYGTESTDPRLPSIEELESIFGEYSALIITDHHDGIWDANDTHDYYLTMDDSTTFRLTNVDAVYLDPYTYEIRDTFTPVVSGPPIFNVLRLRDSSGAFWALTLTNDGTLDISPQDPGWAGPPALRKITMNSPDGGVWVITATADGTVEVTAGTPGTIHLESIVMNSIDASDESVWTITATNDGSLDISATV